MSDVRLIFSIQAVRAFLLRLQQHHHRRVAGRHRARHGGRRRRLHRDAHRDGDLVPRRRALGRGPRAAAGVPRPPRRHGRRRHGLRRHRLRAVPRPGGADRHPLDRSQRVGTDHDRRAGDARLAAGGRAEPGLRALQRGRLPRRRGWRPGRRRPERLARPAPRPAARPAMAPARADRRGHLRDVGHAAEPAGRGVRRRAGGRPRPASLARRRAAPGSAVRRRRVRGRIHRPDVHGLLVRAPVRRRCRADGPRLLRRRAAPGRDRRSRPAGWAPASAC